MSEWIDIKKTNGWINCGYVLVWIIGGIENIKIARFDTGYGWQDSHLRRICGEVTHYMSLPKSPFEEVEE